MLWAGVPGDELVLAPGETLALPAVHLIGYTGDMTAGGNACRRYLYDVVCPGLGGRPALPTLSYDSFFGVATDFDEAFLRRQVDRAAELGLEYFVVDAGWYDGCGPPDGRGPFRLGVGNWEHVDTRKFPQGLESLAAYVAAKGLALGLWFDIERAHVTSRWANEHPDWYLSVDEDFIHRQHVTGAVIEPGRTPVSSPGGTPVGGPGPDFKHLNLGVPAAQERVIAVIGDWVERLDLKWIRWDYNFGPDAVLDGGRSDGQDRLPPPGRAVPRTGYAGGPVPRLGDRDLRRWGTPGGLGDAAARTGRLVFRSYR